jgi:hypothetical protein
MAGMSEEGNRRVALLERPGFHGSPRLHHPHFHRDHDDNYAFSASPARRTCAGGDGHSAGGPDVWDEYDGLDRAGPDARLPPLCTSRRYSLVPRLGADTGRSDGWRVRRALSPRHIRAVARGMQGSRRAQLGKIVSLEYSRDRDDTLSVYQCKHGSCGQAQPLYQPPSYFPRRQAAVHHRQSVDARHFADSTGSRSISPSCRRAHNAAVHAHERHLPCAHTHDAEPTRLRVHVGGHVRTCIRARLRRIAISHTRRTFQLGFIFSIVIGEGVGECLFGRYAMAM